MNSSRTKELKAEHFEASSMPKIAVGIATRGRPQVLGATLAEVAKQTLAPYRTVVCYADADDIGDLPSRNPHVTFLQGAAGLTKQRNLILVSARDADIVVFFDDDFFPHPCYLEAMDDVFSRHCDVVAATGVVLADGISGPGLTVESAHEQLRRWHNPGSVPRVRPVFNVYGCNMAFRVDTFASKKIAFDEHLPLYAWYEDVAFSRELARFGKIAHVSTAVGVHLGVKKGRQSGVRLGYSQIANPLYLARKGLVSWLYALSSMCSRTTKNALRVLHPEPWVDRSGRLRGNLLGWIDALRGVSQPSRINHL